VPSIQPQKQQPQVQPHGLPDTCATHGDGSIPRRPFLKGMLVAAAGVASFVGTSVGFAPSAMAAPNCTATLPQPTSCGPNFTGGCFGECSSSNSCCTFSEPIGSAPPFSKCCACYLYCGNARVVVYPAGKTCYYCCQYC